jgi:hypothetical protein
MLGSLCRLVHARRTRLLLRRLLMTTSTIFPTSGAMIDVEGVSKSFGETEAFVSVKLEGPCGHRAGVLGPNGAGKTTLVGLRNLGVYVDPQHAGLAAGLRQSPAHRPSRQHRASAHRRRPRRHQTFSGPSGGASPSWPSSPHGSPSLPEGLALRDTALPPKPREQMP